MTDDSALLPFWVGDLSRRLKSNDPNFKHLNLNIRKINEVIAHCLAGPLRGNTTLCSLNLTSSFQQHPSSLSIMLRDLFLETGDNDLQVNDEDKHRDQIEQGDEPHPELDSRVLRSLHLGYNRIKDMSAFGAMLEHPKCTLSELFLMVNSIDDDGCLALAKSLEVNQSIRRLVLTKNRIGNAGCVALARALKRRNPIKGMVVDLRANDIEQLVPFDDSDVFNKSRPVEALAQAVRHNIGLHCLMVFESITPEQQHLDVLTLANKKGKAALGKLLPTFWPTVLANVGDGWEQPSTKRSVRFLFLKERVDLFSPGDDNHEVDAFADSTQRKRCRAA